MLAHVIVAILIASNADGKTMVRQNQGTVVPVKPCKTLIRGFDGAAAAHVYFDGTSIRDTKVNAWSMTGSVTMVAPSGVVPPGAQFSDAKYYTLPSPNALNFSGGVWSACWVFYGAGGVPTASGNAGVTTGWWMYAASPPAGIRTNNNLGPASATNPAVAGYNVACGGRDGTNNVVKVNLGVYASTAAAFTADTSTATYLGRHPVASNAFTGTLYEAWFSTSPPSDALFTQIMYQVKSKLGITAW